MRVNLIRRNISDQCFHLGTHEGSDTIEVKSFFWYQVGTSGWTSGPRNRMKQFGSLGKVFAYLYKLRVGSWLSDEDYHTAWTMALNIESTETTHGLRSD